MPEARGATPAPSRPRPGAFAAPVILLDCRWLPLTGAGRTVELLLKGLAAEPPDGRWRLWGPPEVQRLAWPGAEALVHRQDPRSRFAQRDALRVPDRDLAVFMHQNRPLGPGRAVTMVYDTIQLHFARNAVERVARRAFLRRVAATSGRVMTISEYTRHCVHRDLRVPLDRISITSLPADAELAQRVGALRRRLRTEPVIFYVGRFAAHKNLARLVDAFGRTEFARDGGRLVLAGGTERDLIQLGVPAAALAGGNVSVRARCPQEELDRLFATSLALVLPSLEEGFGLPAWEARACGLPVCTSDGGALPEVMAGAAGMFPATSVTAMAAAIDEVAAAARSRPASAAEESSAAFLAAAPTVVDFARQVRVAVSAALG